MWNCSQRDQLIKAVVFVTRLFLLSFSFVLVWAHFGACVVEVQVLILKTPIEHH